MSFFLFKYGLVTDPGLALKSPFFYLSVFSAAIMVIYYHMFFLKSLGFKIPIHLYVI